MLSGLITSVIEHFVNHISRIKHTFLGVILIKEYSIQISTNIYVPEDLTKNCALYPNPVFETYRDCDEEFMRNIVSSLDPPDLVPVWLAKNFTNVTSKITMKHLGKTVAMYAIVTSLSQAMAHISTCLTALNCPTAPCLAPQHTWKLNIYLTELRAVIFPPFLSVSRARCW